MALPPRVYFTLQGRVHRQMHLAPLAAALDTVLSGLPFAIAEELDPGAVHQQVQGAISAPIRDLDGQRLLASAQGGVARHGPIQVGHLQQTDHHPGGLRQRQFEQYLDRQTNWIAASEKTVGWPGLPSCGAS